MTNIKPILLIISIALLTSCAKLKYGNVISKEYIPAHNEMIMMPMMFTSESVKESPYNEGMGILPGGTIKYTLEIITDTEN